MDSPFHTLIQDLPAKESDWIQGVVQHSGTKLIDFLNRSIDPNDLPDNSRSSRRNKCAKIKRGHYRQLIRLSALPKRALHLSKALFDNGQQIDFKSFLFDLINKPEQFTIIQNYMTLKIVYYYCRTANEIAKVLQHYGTNPTLLLSKMYDLDPKQIKGTPKLSFQWGHLVIFFDRKEDFEAVTKQNIGVSHAALIDGRPISKFPDMAGSIILVNLCVLENNSDEQRNTVRHELGHGVHWLLNSLIYSQDNQPLLRIKDEIIAYLFEGLEASKIKNLLIKQDAYSHFWHSDRDMRPSFLKPDLQAARSVDGQHQLSDEALIRFSTSRMRLAQTVKESFLTNGLVLLMITPMTKWHRLHRDLDFIRKNVVQPG
ncbi:MAG: hypothetical protein HQL54_00970 [Magnetococcales bacterium]|nr:hypothetical protein [Magnetococcales bacterium]